MGWQGVPEVHGRKPGELVQGHGGGDLVGPGVLPSPSENLRETLDRERARVAVLERGVLEAAVEVSLLRAAVRLLMTAAATDGASHLAIEIVDDQTLLVKEAIDRALAEP